MNDTMLAVIPVRAGVLPLGAQEVTAEAGGSALLIGSDCLAAAEQLIGVAIGLWFVEPGPFSPGRWAAVVAAALAEIGPAAEGHLLLPASPDGRDLGPRLAATLDRDFVAAAVRVTLDRAEVTRFGGRVTEVLGLGRPIVASFQPGVRGVEPLTTGPDTVPTPIEIRAGQHPGDPTAASAGAGLGDPRLIEELPADPSTMDLAEADRIVAGGAGLGSPEAFDTLRGVADRLGASPGGTRVVTDWGWLPVERQIGTTGVTVDPSLYLAVGISGAVQHTAGLGSPDHIISVNTDPHCPMMAMADLAIVCDGPQFLSRLLECLAEPADAVEHSKPAAVERRGRAPLNRRSVDPAHRLEPGDGA